MPETLVYERELPPEFEHQVLAFMRMEWPRLFTGPNRFRNRVSDFPLTHVVRCEGEILLSYAGVVWTNASDVALAGLTSVLTFPPFRREGHGGAVVAAATQLIVASDADVGLLFCREPTERLYTRHGWRTLDRGRVIVGDRVPDSLVMALAASENGRAVIESFADEPLRLSRGW